MVVAREKIAADAWALLCEQNGARAFLLSLIVDPLFRSHEFDHLFPTGRRTKGGVECVPVHIRYEQTVGGSLQEFFYGRRV